MLQHRTLALTVWPAGTGIRRVRYDRLSFIDANAETECGSDETSSKVKAYGHFFYRCAFCDGGRVGERRHGTDLSQSGLPAAGSGRRHAAFPARGGATCAREVQARNHHLFAEGVSSSNESLSRLLRLLPLPARSRRGRGAHHDARRGDGSRARGPAHGMYGSVVQFRRQAGAAISADARYAAAIRIQIHVALSGSNVREGAP